MSARPLLAQPLLAVVVLTLAACGSTVQEGSELTVYASVPLSGPDRATGRDLADGMESALSRAGGEAGGVPVTLEVLDGAPAPGSPGGSRVWAQARVAANARQAAEDSTSIAYIGEAEAGATRVSVPITNEAGIAQVTPGPVGPAMLSGPGGDDVPAEYQPSGERTLVTLIEEGEELAVGEAELTGEEAMALVLDAIDHAADPLSRASVTAALFETAGRSSPLGTYSIGPTGRAAFSR